MEEHPCMKCGACCSYFRVLFDTSETAPESFHVPANLTARDDGEKYGMRGTLGKRPRCIALSGTVGHQVACTIYDRRPGCCRAFKASLEDGIENARCDKAREAKGLKPLTAEDWGSRPETGSETGQDLRLDLDWGPAST